MEKFIVKPWQFVALVAVSFAGMTMVAWILSKLLAFVGITSLESQPVGAILATLVFLVADTLIGVIIFNFSLPRFCQKR